MSAAPFSAVHRRHVQSLYRRFLKNSLDWTIDRTIWRQEALQIRAAFEATRLVLDITDPRELSRVLENAEKILAARAHPDPVISPAAPGGTKWERNIPPSTQPPFPHEKYLH